ncbi:PilX N-terminal domain-containing pilus assembly protein [Pseudomonadota bacterium]
MTQKQTGSALIISLLILLVMTMVGINSMTTSALEEKMAGNDRNHKVNFQNAETNLKAAETSIANMKWSTELYVNLAIGRANGADHGGYVTEDAAAIDNYFKNSPWNPGVNCVSLTAGSKNKSCYIIEVIEGPYQGTSFSLYPRQYGELPPDPGKFISKITLRNTNGTGNVYLQSTHRKLALD